MGDRKEDLKQLISSWKESSEDALIVTAKELHNLIRESPKLSILALVESLSEPLTSENVEDRLKGIQILTHYLHQCQPKELNGPELETLVLYLCGKLKDHHTIQPLIIYGFLSLVSHQNVDDNLLKILIAALFAEVHVQSLVQADRHNVFNLFGNLLKLRLDVLKMVSGDFVLGFIQAVDGERDPRNLLLCFENSYVVLTQLDFSLFIEDFFEVLSCYFPVEFNPPKDNPFGITREDLVDKLHLCLSCTPLFAPYSISLYIEKLSSDMSDAKLDALSLITTCFHMYGNEIQLFATEIWTCIRRDFLFGEDIVLKSKYRDFINGFIDCLSKESNAETLNSVMDSFKKACLQSLKDPDLTIAVQCGQLIELFANKSSKINDQILKSVLNPLETTIMKGGSTDQRSTLLLFVHNLLFIDPSKTSPEIQKIYQSFVSKLTSILYDSLQGDENMKLTNSSLLCLIRIMQNNELFNIDSDIMFEHFFNMLFSKVKDCSDNIFKQAIESISCQYPVVVKTKFINHLENNNSREFVARYLCLLPFCPKDDENKLLSYLLGLIFAKDKLSDMKFFTDIVNCFCTIMESSKTNYSKEEIFVPLLTNLNLANCKDDDTLKVLFKYFKMVSRAFLNLEKTDQFVIVSNTVNVIENNVNSNKVGTLFVLLCAANHLSVGELDTVGARSWHRQLLGMLANGEDPLYEITGLTISLLLNKIGDPKSIQEALVHVRQQGNNPKAITLLSWVTKGCVLNWQSTSTKGCLTDLIANLESNDLATSQEAVNGFQILCSLSNQDKLITELNWTTRLMYKQRFSQYVLPMLMERYHEIKTDTAKAAIMKALSYTIQVIPKQMLQSYFDKLIPLLMQSLEQSEDDCASGDDEMIFSSLSTILAICDEDQNVFRSHLDSLVARLLRVAKNKQMKIRSASLKCLVKLSGYPPHTIVPLKKEVLRAIAPLLDDRKRLVRKDAVLCSNVWHLVG